MKYDVGKYLERIRYSGSLAPDLEVLRQLQKQHLFNIPFENLDIHYNIPIELDIDKIYNKIVLHRRGGYCYELNGLFNELLSTLGFRTKLISARVFTGGNGYTPEFDHLTILVNIEDNDYLTDVGFGEFTLTPLKMELGKVQSDARGQFVIDTYGDGYFRVNKIDQGRSVPVFIFKNTARELQDFAEMNQFHQTNPDSPFKQKRLISRPTENGRITITGNTLKIKEKDSLTEKELKNEIEFERVLWEFFKIRIDIPNSRK